MMEKEMITMIVDTLPVFYYEKMVGYIFNYIIQGLSVLGILCGITVPASLVIDMIALATLHISTLHWFISLVYSSQLQALAALWRLFRY